MNKLIFVLFFVFVFFGFISNTYAQCNGGQPINLTCTQDLQLSWTSTEQNPNSCAVAGPGWSGSSQCNQTQWVTISSNVIPGGTSYYTFNGEPISGVPPQMSDTCRVEKPTNCGPTGGGTYTISAAPNPVQICSPATQGSSNISWTAPAGQAVNVYVDGNLFASSGGPGSQIAPWIRVGVNSTFELRKQGSSVVEDSVTVTGTNSGCSTGVGVCGDGTLNSGTNSQGINEQCDDGNVVNGDGCSSTCQIQTTPSAFYCQTTTMCSQCGGTTGITCPTNVYQSSACGGACPAGGVCGNGVLEGTEQCDQGGQNGLPTSTCSLTCTTQTPSLPSADIGFDSTYTKNETITLATGQTTTDVTLYMTSANISSGTCDLQQYNAYGNNHWNSIHSGNSRNQSITRTRNLAVGGPYSFRYVCSGATSGTAQLTINQATASPAVSCTPSPQTIPATFKFNWAASGFSNSGEVRCTEDGTLLAKGVVSGSFTRNAPGPYSVVCTKSPETASASCIAQAAPVCGNGIVEPPEECDGGANCSSTCQTTGCGSGICNASCPQNCTNDNSLCVGGQAFITSPANGRVLINNPFTVAFSFQNIGGTTWTNPTYQVSTTASTFSSWRTVFGTRALSPTSIAGILGGSQSTNTYTQQFTAPGTAGTYPLAFTVIKTGTAFGDQCLVNSTGQVTVSVPQCNDNSDNDGDGKIDCGVTIKGVTYPADPGCFPNGNGGGGACNVNKDDETDNSGVNMGITANPQLVRQNGTSEVSFTCDASTWSVAGPQVGGITGVVRDTTTLGCTNANVFCGTGAQTNKVFPATNIQVKETYTLRCGGKERSATISVIKINEI